MKRFIVFLVSVFVVTLVATNIYATSFTSFDQDEGGTGSATMDIAITLHTLIITLDNTSPVTLDDSSGPNTPGISGFGFDIDPDITYTSWSLMAYNINGGSADLSTGNLWVLSKDTGPGNLKFDYYPESDSQNDNINEALFNPAAIAVGNNLPGGSNINYFTTATLTMLFPENINAVSRPFVRMKNVGLNGEGSLKIFLEEGNAPPSGGQVPEPSTIFLLGIGLLVAGGWRRKKKK